MLNSQPDGRHRRNRPSSRLKRWILENQDGLCLGCALRLEQVEFDHVVPLGLGGGNNPDNWAALCPSCHKRKTIADLRQIAKAKRQRRYHLTGRSRSAGAPGGHASAKFARHIRRHLNGVITHQCDCRNCRPTLDSV